MCLRVWWLWTCTFDTHEISKKYPTEKISLFTQIFNIGFLNEESLNFKQILKEYPNKMQSSHTRKILKSKDFKNIWNKQTMIQETYITQTYSLVGVCRGYTWKGLKFSSSNGFQVPFQNNNGFKVCQFWKPW